MAKKALFIWFKRYTELLEGGGLVNSRNYYMAQQILGDENVESYYVHDEAHPSSLINKMFSAALFPFGYFNGLTPKKLRTILRKAQGFDYVFISTSVFGIIAKHLKKTGYKGIVIAHFHNVESIFYQSYISKRVPLRRIIIECAYRNDGYCMQYADRIVTLNSRDYNMLSYLHGIHKDGNIIPASIPDKFDSKKISKSIQTSSRPKCLFVGSRINANTEGVLWFVRNVLPHVDIDFMVVGKGMAKFKSVTSELENIEVVGDAPELDLYYYDADFLVMPIFSGSGMKVKTCEALMYGKNILCTDEALEGYDIDGDKFGGRCNTADEFISAIRHYSKHPIPRHNAYSRLYYESKLAPAVIQEKFRQVLQ